MARTSSGHTRTCAFVDMKLHMPMFCVTQGHTHAVCLALYHAKTCTCFVSTAQDLRLDKTSPSSFLAGAAVRPGVIRLSVFDGDQAVQQMKAETES